MALVGSGTAGHVNPALAVADRIAEGPDNIGVMLIGTSRGQESTLVASSGYPLETIAAAPFHGVGWPARAAILVQFPRGVIQARRLLRDSRIRLVVSFGGYASAAVVLAAATLGIPIVVHEANARAGLANRLVARLAGGICLGFETASIDFPAGVQHVTGTPVRREFVSVTREAARKDGGGRGPRRILVSGGSLGSTFLNERVPELLARIGTLGVDLEVEHYTGGLDGGAVAEAYRREGLRAEVAAWTADMAAACARADFAITRAGACTIAELGCSGVPALLVPLSEHAGGHQVANAKACADIADTLWVTESSWSIGPLAKELAALLGDDGALDAAGHRAARLFHPGAADAVADIVRQQLELPVGS